MAVQGKDAVGADQVTAVADTGYSNGEHGALSSETASPLLCRVQKIVNRMEPNTSAVTLQLRS